MKRKEILEKILGCLTKRSGASFNLVWHSEKGEYDEEYEYNELTTDNKMWRLGIWILKSDDGKGYKVYMFAEHKWFIDKFKPTATAISHECLVYEDSFDDGDSPLPIFSFACDAMSINASNIGSMVKWYWGHYGAREGVFLWLLSTWWFYSIMEPIRRWWRTHGMHLPLLLTKALYKIVFGRKISVEIRRMEDLFSPKWDFRVIYNVGLETDEAFNIYCKINSKVVKGEDGKNVVKYRKFLLPYWFYDGFVRLINAENKEDWRGFYWELKLKEEEEKA